MNSYQDDLQRLAVLPDGWDGENGKPPTEKALMAVEKLLRSRATIVPCSDGGLQIDWPNGEITFTPEGEQEF